jgi:hypothetical protein
LLPTGGAAALGAILALSAAQVALGIWRPRLGAR